MSTDTVVRARIDSDTKDRATVALEAMGLTVSDAIRMLLARVAVERRIPFEVKIPTAAMEESERGGGKRFDDADKPLDDPDLPRR